MNASNIPVGKSQEKQGERGIFAHSGRKQDSRKCFLFTPLVSEETGNCR